MAPSGPKTGITSRSRSVPRRRQTSSALGVCWHEGRGDRREEEEPADLASLTTRTSSLSSWVLAGSLAPFHADYGQIVGVNVRTPRKSSYPEWYNEWHDWHSAKHYRGRARRWQAALLVSSLLARSEHGRAREGCLGCARAGVLRGKARGQPVASSPYQVCRGLGACAR